MRFFGWLLASAVGCLTWAALIAAQVQIGDAKQLGEKSDETSFNAGLRGQFMGLLKGERQPDDNKIFELASRYYVYRVTWAYSVQRDQKEMERVRTAFSQDMSAAAEAILEKKNNQQALRKFSPPLVARFKEVFELPFDKNRMACLNAALMLPDMAKLQQPVIADFLADLIQDSKQHDVVRMWAGKAMAEFFPAREFILLDHGNKAKELQKKQELKRVDALLKLITRPCDSQEYASPKQVEAFRWIRKEATKALAEARVPAIEVDGKAGKVEGPAAQVFLTFLANKPAITPEPKLDDKIEAALGLCRIRVDPNSGYIPLEGVYRVGTFLVEFANAYRVDYTLFHQAGAKKDLPSALPWRLHSKRLQSALREMWDTVAPNADVLHQKAAAYASVLNKNAMPLLKAMEKHGAVDLAEINGLATAVQQMRPETAQIYKGVNAGKGE